MNSRKIPVSKFDEKVRLAGGTGMYAAKQENEALLRRLVLANLLWENLFYVDGKTAAKQIADLIPNVEPEAVARLAIEARKEQKLRHVPLFIAREMARYPSHRGFVKTVLREVITRADQITDFIALYRKDSKALSMGVRKGLKAAFHRFNAYQFAKYAGKKNTISMQDAIRMIHPVPDNAEQAKLFKMVSDETLSPADTWEVALSSGKNKKETWERLISEGKLGALAFLRNLRNMEKDGVGAVYILKGFGTINPGMLLPINFFAAASAAPAWTKQIEDMMLRSLGSVPKLPGVTILVVDVSGSMNAVLSDKSLYTRLNVAGMLATMANEVCAKCEIWITAGSDNRRVHKTEKLSGKNRGFALAEEISERSNDMGGGGIFTRQALNFIRENSPWIAGNTPDRIIVFSDSQDCDTNKSLPSPFGTWNYIVDVSAEKNGINYKGVWNGGEVSGWSDSFLTWIGANEGIVLADEEQDQ
jgi:hypothetical protein